MNTKLTEVQVEGTTASIEIVEDVDSSTVILSLEELLKSHASSISRLQEEKKKLSDMIADGLNNDVLYKEADDKVKIANKERLAVKQQIMSRPGAIDIVNKLKDIKAELKEKKSSISDYALEYKRMSGSNQLELFDDMVYEIVETAKLIKVRRK